MPNKYLSYITDEHLLECIDFLYNSYEKAKEKITKKSFYENKVDVFKMIFDKEFNQQTDEQWINTEILRQVDKGINNSIGAFHERILGGIKGYERGVLAGFDIKANDNTLFADIKNKHNTMNSSSAESLFQKLKVYADQNKKAKCYCVQILAKSSFNELWKATINGKEYSHSRVYTISGDQFYSLLTGKPTALFDLYQALPIAITDYLKDKKIKTKKGNKGVASDITKEATDAKRSTLNHITAENFGYYLGFDKL